MNFETLGAFPIVRNMEVCGLGRTKVGISFQFSLRVWRLFNSIEPQPKHHHSPVAGNGDYLSTSQYLT